MISVQSPQRRRLLGAGAVIAAASIAGCASVGRSGGRVVVVGGGYGGDTAARYLKLWGGRTAVTLIERDAHFVSCPISNLVLSGDKDIADLTRDYRGLAALGVDVVHGDVTAIDVSAKTVRLADGRSFACDRVIVSPGIDFVTSGVAGLDAALSSGRVLHAWKAGPQTVALRKQLVAMADGGVFAMSIPPSPYRCPPGPYERACLVASYFKAAKPKSKIIIYDANPDIQSKKALFLKAWAEHYPGMIDYRPNSILREVSADGVARFDFEDSRAAVLNVIPAQQAGNIARAAGLVNANDRWCHVDWLTFESTAVPGVHVLGDSTMHAPQMPKSGHMANQHGKVAAAAVLALLRGEPPIAAPKIVNTCYSFVTGSEAMHVASVHVYDAAAKTLEPVPGAGGLSPAATELEGRYALSWAQNIWADMLGSR